MKASRFSDAQKAFILKQGDEGVSVAEICREAGISQATYFNWKKKYPRHAAAGDEEAEAARGRECATEEIVADLTLDREMLQDVIRRKL